MSDDGKNFFEWTEFASDSESKDPEAVIQERQNPEIAYAHICKIAGTINAGLDAVPEDQRDTAEVYAVVDLFRATMQYIEEFGSYLRYLILDKDSFINEIIRTSSGDIRPLFEAFIEDELDEYLQEHDVDDDPDELLSSVFGYEAVQKGMIGFSEEDLEDAPPDGDLEDVVLRSTEEGVVPEGAEMEELVSDSVENARNKLKDIALFYLNFREAYNAVKHGNRVTVGNNTQFELENDEMLDNRMVLDEAIVEFLCKNSDPESDGEPYLLTIPRSILEEKSLDIVENVYTLYTQSYDVATLEDGDEINLSFWKSTGSSGESENDLIQISNPDSRIILPRSVVPKVIEDLKIPDETKIEWTSDWSLSGDTLEFEVQYETESTPEYPIHVELVWEQTEHDIHEFGEGQFNFNVSTDDLSVRQYLELLEIKRRDDIRTVELVFPDDDETHQLRMEDDFEPIDVPEPANPEFFEFVKRIGLATDTRIPYPEHISEKHWEVYEEYADCDLDSETAEEILSELRECGEEVMRSYVIVAVWEDESSSVDVDEDEPAHVEELGVLPGILNVSEDQGSEESERFPGEEYRTYPAGSECTSEELLDKLKEDYGGTFSELQELDIDSEEAESEFSHRIRFGEETLWGTIDQHIIDIFPVSGQSP
ncbi:hypothetical protein C483_02211 [Natrialba hulunbeirensis JCM 10989]|uniref:Uncharacterized protein n=1 Tax=Natrialba hulunbeirensis JCM 10989 TaxID=1227493 RepID=M0A8Q3_9EURY|nr:hypothetical protein [Natrialba hulunbeirensis]ELY95140.1 hypothetical protein C483_02211 [Natrialba hulunbeirensis JCM 10989]